MRTNVKKIIAETQFDSVCGFFEKTRRNIRIVEAPEDVAIQGRKDACYEKINV